MMIRWGKQVPLEYSDCSECEKQRDLSKGVAKETSHVMCVAGSISCMAKVSENDLQQGEHKGRKIYAAVTTGVLVEESQHCGNLTLLDCVNDCKPLDMTSKDVIVPLRRCLMDQECI
ncbi:hypothetical protein EMCRGX_G012350 [Ephydatia muelleri]